MSDQWDGKIRYGETLEELRRRTGDACLSEAGKAIVGEIPTCNVFDEEKKFTTIPTGSLLTVTTGEYSDYYVRGVFRALRDIDADRLLAQWLTEHPEQQKDYTFEENEFLGWIAKEGYLEPIDCFEWHLSDDSNASEMAVWKLDSDIET